ncbi:MotA/TolQ/ExbB proton channel family protein [Tenacibaculum dicentrarchi]|uniref:MotA/TolQ/ExbB proton channel family protein n=1 Tax=Tenacibaculum piscium TaxID=1458515 RepID=UPI001E509C6B|nr:MotA/TolQ/ExbB proton channel family protein [Tenacibaculum piscium]MCD8406401.1 MotA/TolQ/ExbB proton channel family protein [Tenacibaculum dicentrarchi]
MKILENVFAYTKDDNFPIGTVVVVILIVSFLAAVFYLYNRKRKLINSIELQNIEKDKELSPIWLAYKKTFIEYQNFTKTNHHAKEFFSEYATLNVKLDVRLLNNVASSLVGLGVLGTFIGLSLGVSSIQLTNTATIKASIDTLLKGMGTAFATSIWGMLLSIIFTFIYKYNQSKISKKINELCLILDSENKIELKELDIIQAEKQKAVIHELFNEYLVADTDEGKQLPKNVFRKLLEESENQTVALQKFADDLGESIADTLEATLEKLTEENGKQLTDLIEGQLVPVLNELKDIKQDSGTAIIETAIENLSNSMRDMMQNFKEEVSGNTKNEMEQISLRLSKVSDSLLSVPETMQNVSNEITETIGLLKNNVLDNITKANQESKASSVENKQLFEEANSVYKETLSEVNNRMDKIIDEQKNNLMLFSDITKEVQKTLDHNKNLNLEYQQILSGSKDVVANINSIANKFQLNSEHIDNTANNLLSSIDTHKKEVLSISSSQNNLLLDINKTIDKTQNVSGTYIQNFETIEEGLQGIFEHLQKGLLEYQTTTSGTLNEYLVSFSTSLKDSQDGLNSILGNLNDMVEDLTESVDKLRKVN